MSNKTSGLTAGGVGCTMPVAVAFGSLGAAPPSVTANVSVLGICAPCRLSVMVVEAAPAAKVAIPTGLNTSVGGVGLVPDPAVLYGTLAANVRSPVRVTVKV